MPTCVRHPDRPTGLRCTRCDRPACPECLREASVGYQCVDCVNEGKRTTRRAKTVAGAELGGRRLVVVPLLIAINVAVYVITAAQAGSLGNNGNSKLSEDWWLWPPIVAYGEWWRMFTAGFLHSGPVHIGLNMIALYILGRELEPLLGRIRFTVVYLISLLGGSTAVFLFGGDAPVVGASGAVFGLMGALVVVVLRRKLNPQPVLMIIGLNIFISVAVPNISLLGHLGGLAIGTIATAALVYAPAKSRVAWQAGALVALTIALVGVIAIRDAQFGKLTCERNPVVVMSCAEVPG